MKTKPAQLKQLMRMGYSVQKNETTKEYLLRHNRRGIAYRSTYQQCVSLGIRLADLGE